MTTPTFSEDHFSLRADEYARHRPTYPPELFAALAALAPARHCAWDCATGSGQAALGLTPHFDLVIATDASPSQVAHATPHDKIEYRVAPAERSRIDAGSIDLLTVAAGAHWFEHDRFFPEVERVLTSGGVCALFSYSPEVRAHPDVDAVIREVTDGVCGPDWPERIHFVRDRYRTLPFPLDEVDLAATGFGPFSCRARWSFRATCGVLRTWSAAPRYHARTGRDLVEDVGPRLWEAWPLDDEEAELDVEIPLFFRVGRVA